MALHVDLTKLLSSWRNSFVHRAVFPPICILCGDRGEGLDLCAGCHADLPWVKATCPRCGRALSTATLCENCQRHSPFYDRIFTAFAYEPPVDHLVVSLKFQDRLAHARLLGELLAESLAKRIGPLPELILPVPLHYTRLRTRGYNQALELAYPVGRRLGVPVAATVCRRVHATTAQSRLSAERRRHNVRGAFAVMQRNKIAGRHVAILDDVVTTGHTVNELARVLCQAGAREIEVWAIARAVP